MVKFDKSKIPEADRLALIEFGEYLMELMRGKTFEERQEIGKFLLDAIRKIHKERQNENAKV